MKKLRSGYTTGACSAAAAKAAMLLFLWSEECNNVEIPFPDGSRVRFVLAGLNLAFLPEKTARASVVKDAGDDPDVTNGAIIEVTVSANPDPEPTEQITLVGGKGIGVVTKPGLAVPVGEPAINPVPRQMINAAVAEAISAHDGDHNGKFLISISMPDGERLAQKTLNKRLGIIGGLSILGTTGIVRPVSAEAWTATISASMKVASSVGIDEIVLSTGRTSEQAFQQAFGFPEEALAMMGDYLRFSLEEAGRYTFVRIHLAGMWAKIVKAAMGIPQTHVRNGSLEVDRTIAFIQGLKGGETAVAGLTGANTAREIYSRLIASGNTGIIHQVCRMAQQYAQNISRIPVTVHLVDISGKIIISTQGT